MGTTARTSRDDGLIVYHDGACPLCRREIALYRRQAADGRLRFVDVSEPGFDMGGPDLDRATALRRFHVRMPDGRVRSGAAGFVAIWQRLPGWRWLARLAGLPGVMPLLEVGYRASLVVRPRLAKLVSRLDRP